MAGIGLRLHRLVAEGGYLRGATAYSASAVISAGPWLTAVLALTVLNLASARFLDQDQRELFFITITYAFGTSLIVTGALQMIVTRYLADRIYSNETSAIAPTCAGVLLLALPLLLLTIPFVILAPFDLRYRLLTSSLFVTLSLIWLMMIFLSAARDYRRLVFIFLLAYTVGVCGAIALGQRFGLFGMLGGFTLGQVACLTLLIEQVFDEFGAPRRPQLSFLAYGRQYWDLALLGLCYNLAIWIDNIIYWLSPLGETIGGLYRAYPPYDATKMIAHLTTIPASAVFLVQLETHFYQHYRTYYRLIARKATLSQIASARQAMIAAARVGFTTIFKLQLAVTGGIVLFAPYIAPRVGLLDAQIPTLRIVTVAASCQFFMLTAMLLLLYLDQRRAALLVVGFFAVSNLAFSLASVRSSDRADGIGYLLATILTAALSLFTLTDRLQRLEFLTFVSQGIGPDIPRPKLTVTVAAYKLPVLLGCVAVLAAVGVLAVWQRLPSSTGSTAQRGALVGVPTATVAEAVLIVPTVVAPAPTVSAPVPASVTPTAQLPATTLFQRAQTAESAIRSGRLDVAIDYGDGTRATVQMTFDLGGSQSQARLRILSTFQGRTGSQVVEQVAIGEQGWRRQGTGPWQSDAGREAMWEQFRSYLPHTVGATLGSAAQDNERTLLSYVDDTGATNGLDIEPTTGAPRQVRRELPPHGLVVVVVYAGLNMPVTIAAPPAP